MSTTDTRAAFEIQAAKDDYRIEVGPNGKDYLSGHTQVAWEWWPAPGPAHAAVAAPHGRAIVASTAGGGG